MAHNQLLSGFILSSVIGLTFSIPTSSTSLSYDKTYGGVLSFPVADTDNTPVTLIRDSADRFPARLTASSPDNNTYVFTYDAAGRRVVIDRTQQD